MEKSLSLPIMVKSLFLMMILHIFNKKFLVFTSFLGVPILKKELLQ